MLRDWKNKFISIYNKQNKTEKSRHCSWDRNSKIFYFRRSVSCLLPGLKLSSILFFQCRKKEEENGKRGNGKENSTLSSSVAYESIWFTFLFFSFFIFSQTCAQLLYIDLKFLLFFVENEINGPEFSRSYAKNLF